MSHPDTRRDATYFTTEITTAHLAALRECIYGGSLSIDRYISLRYRRTRACTFRTANSLSRVNTMRQFKFHSTVFTDPPAIIEFHRQAYILTADDPNRHVQRDEVNIAFFVCTRSLAPAKKTLESILVSEGQLAPGGDMRRGIRWRGIRSRVGKQSVIRTSSLLMLTRRSV